MPHVTVQTDTGDESRRFQPGQTITVVGQNYDPDQTFVTIPPEGWEVEVTSQAPGTFSFLVPEATPPGEYRMTTKVVGKRNQTILEEAFDLVIEGASSILDAAGDVMESVIDRLGLGDDEDRPGGIPGPDTGPGIAGIPPVPPARDPIDARPPADGRASFPRFPIPVTLNRSASEQRESQCLGDAIRQGTRAISFGEFDKAIRSLCVEDRRDALFLQEYADIAKAYAQHNVLFSGTNGYFYLKAAAEAFLLSRAPVFESYVAKNGATVYNSALLTDNANRNQYWPAGDSRFDGECGGKANIPYLAAVASRVNRSFASGDNVWCDLINERLRLPYMIELIWSYWQEEGMLVQTLNVLSARFQNVVPAGIANSLENFELGPLRLLNNIFWGYIQEEPHRLSVPRRVQEYDHHYGLKLQGRAVSRVRSADSRSKFIEAFHNLLSAVVQFYRQDDDTTVIADGFPLLNSLRDVHIVLSQGAHNQFGDLPSTARVEMLMQQWILARPEMDRFLPQREMVAYPEPWMGPVDAMKSLQGWTDVSAMHFGRLATFGEQILLSIRYGFWSSDAMTAIDAVNWARDWRNEIQGYVHAYRVVTGVDLAADLIMGAAAAERYMQPSVHIARRQAGQGRRGVPLPGGLAARSIPATGNRPPLPVPARTSRGPRP